MIVFLAKVGTVSKVALLPGRGGEERTVYPFTLFASERFISSAGQEAPAC
jgi:hypothetical protein